MAASNSGFKCKGLLGDCTIRKGQYVTVLPFRSGAGKEARTLDLNLGKVALYQLSYSRVTSLIVYTGIKVICVGFKKISEIPF